MRLTACCAMSIGAIAVASMTVMAGGCRQQRSKAGSPQAEETCVADSIGPLRILPTISACSEQDWLCRAKCRAGNAASCLALAYTAEANPKTAGGAMALYHRACLLGAANACTNYAASVWAGVHSEAQLACARRTLEKACSAREPFACGMVGRFMLESTPPAPVAEARNYLEAACDELGGFSCRVLARHLESGKLGDYRPDLIRSLLQRACAGGDPDACGEPASAAATFH